MGTVQKLASFLPSIEAGRTNVIRTAWDWLSALPFGKSLFSRFVGSAAPYTGTIGADVVELSHGHSRVVMKDRRAVRNHLRCVHAVALSNLAELTGNVAVGYSMPEDARFIVAGMSIEYLKKARGRITAICDCPTITSSERCEYQVPVSLHNEASEEVARATLRTLIGPKKG